MAQGTLYPKIEYRLYGCNQPQQWTLTEDHYELTGTLSWLPPNPDEPIAALLQAVKYGPLPNCPTYFETYAEAAAWYAANIEPLTAKQREFYSVGNVYKTIVVAKTVTLLPCLNSNPFERSGGGDIKTDAELSHVFTWPASGSWTGTAGLKVLAAVN